MYDEMNLFPNQRVKRLFRLIGYELKRAQTGVDYLLLRLASSGFMIKGYVWENPYDAAQALSDRNLVEVEGRVKEIFDNILVIKVDAIAPARERRQDIHEYYRMLLDYVRSIRNPYCHRLLSSFFKDSAFMERFTSYPGGLTIHHGVRGGLLIHTVSVMRCAHFLYTMYGLTVNKDILLTGAFLHDIGKTVELSDNGTYTYTPEGNLLGHVHAGLMLLNEKIGTIDGFPDDLALILRNMVAVHHGPWKGNNVSVLPETLVLHFVDSLDFRMDRIQSLIIERTGRQRSIYDRILKARIYLGLNEWGG